MPFLPFMPNVDTHLQMFTKQLYLTPGGPETLGQAQFFQPIKMPETAGWDTSPLGAQAIRSLAGIKNAADEMALASQQSQAIARNTKIAAVRTYEALKSYEEIFAREAAAAAEKAASGLPGMPGGVPKPGGIPAMGPAGEEGPAVDVNGGTYLRQDLELAFANVRKVSMDAAESAASILKKYQQVRSTARAVEEALNLPGYQTPPLIPPVFLKPPKRPRDLAPFWLDLPYGMNAGADPYATHTGAPRDSAASTIRGYPGFNPMEGTVPIGENGLSTFYKEIKPGGMLKLGLGVPKKSFF